MRIVISSGHGRYIRGAAGILEEVIEARRVTETVASYLREAGVEVVTFHDQTSRDQSTNLETIVAAHNAETRQLDVSVHLNAYVETSSPMGVEVLYVTQEDLARRLSAAMAEAGGLIDRGPKYRSDLYVLNQTEEPCVLLECCFVDSSADAALWRENFDAICRAVARTISGVDVPERPDLPPWPDRPDRPPADGALLHVQGPCSWFGGPDDHGVDADEGLAFLYDFEDAPHLFLYDQPAGTSGLARRLDPETFYVACRWDYDRSSKDMLRDQSRKAVVRAKGQEFLAYPADWGPNENTGRVADLSPALMQALELMTDDVVEVIYPA